MTNTIFQKACQWNCAEDDTWPAGTSKRMTDTLRTTNLNKMYIYTNKKAFFAGWVSGSVNAVRRLTNGGFGIFEKGNTQCAKT